MLHGSLILKNYFLYKCAVYIRIIIKIILNGGWNWIMTSQAANNCSKMVNNLKISTFYQNFMCEKNKISCSVCLHCLFTNSPSQDQKREPSRPCQSLTAQACSPAPPGGAKRAPKAWWERRKAGGKRSPRARSASVWGAECLTCLVLHVGMAAVDEYYWTNYERRLNDLTGP